MARTGLEDAIQGQSVDIGLAVTEVRLNTAKLHSEIRPIHIFKYG